MKILSIFFINILLLSLNLNALTYQGEIKSSLLYNCQHLTKKESKYIDKICIKEVKVRYRLSTLMQEPIESYSVAWSIDPTLYLRNKSVDIKSMPKKVQEAFSKLSPLYPTKFYISAIAGTKSKSNVHLIFDPGVMKKSGKGFSFNMSGSPSWDKFISDNPIILDNFDYEKDTHYLDRKNAIKAFKTLSNFYFGGVIELTFAGISDLNWALSDAITYPVSISVFSKKNNLHIDCDIYLINQKKMYRNYMQLKSGNYNIKIEAKGYKTLYKNIHIDNLHKEFTFIISKTENRKETKKGISKKETKKPQKKKPVTKKMANLKQSTKSSSPKKATKPKVVSIDNSFNKIFGEENTPKSKNRQKSQNKKKSSNTTQDTEGSILMLIDVSGSMDGEKLNSAKNAAISSINSAVKNRTEVAILSFSGECNSPISRKINFTKDRARLISFVKSLQAGGGTPLGSALREANNFMQKNKNPSSRLQLILLLADGDGQCGNVNAVLNELKKRGIVFRHETIGLGVKSNSNAARDLRRIANKTGGGYHHTNNPKQLKKIFMKALDTIEILDMIGKFDSNTKSNKKDSKDMQNILDMMN